MLDTTLGEITLSPQEQAIVDSLARQKAKLIETLLAWSAQNSGSHNQAGLTAMRELLRTRARRLNASVTDRDLAEGEYVTPSGEKKTVSYAPRAPHSALWNLVKKRMWA